MTVKVLIVDDSPTMRHIIGSRLGSEPDIAVVGQASNPNEARRLVKELNPDVMTLDVEMPEMNGIEFLEKVMRLRPMPVIMVSTLTRQGAAISTEALALGAFDCVSKPGPDSPFGLTELADKVRAAAGAAATIRLRRGVEPPRPAPAATYRSNGHIVAIGASTGGVETLGEILSAFPRNCPPTVVVQHMPELFTARLAGRLNTICAPDVEEATEGSVLEVGKILIAPGGRMHTLVNGGPRPSCRLQESDPVGGHRPAVDVLFDSVAKTQGRRAVGVILTGMGRDGASGLLRMHQAGAKTFGQDEATSIVYGMPRVAHELGAVDVQLPSTKIAAATLASTNQLSV